MSNLLIYKATICQEVIKNERQLGRVLKKIEEYSLIALRTGRIVGIDLKELEKPPKFPKPKKKKNKIADT